MNFLNELWQSLTNYYFELVHFIPDAIVGILGFLLFWFLGNRTKRLIKRRLATHIDDRLLTNFIAQVAKVFWLVAGFLFLLKVIGWGDAAAGIMATAGLSAFVIGFAFKDIGENFLAGIALAFKRPFKIGDVIETNGITGTINTMELRDTHIKTFDGKDVYLPNAMLLKNPLFNYTIDGFLRFEMDFRLEYESDLALASRIVLEEAHKTPGILRETKIPQTTISGIGTSELVLRLYFWIGTYDKDTSVFQIKLDLYQRCMKALRENGFHLPNQIVEVRNFERV